MDHRPGYATDHAVRADCAVVSIPVKPADPPPKPPDPTPVPDSLPPAPDLATTPQTPVSDRPPPVRRRRGFLGRCSLVFFELLAGLLALLLLGGGVLAWRLTQAPLSVDWLTPHIEQAINDRSPVRVELAGTRIRWPGFGAPLSLRAEGVEILNEEGAPIARLAETDIALSLPALLEGRVAPARIELVAPVLLAVRDPDGSMRLNLRTDGQDEAPGDGGRVLGDIVQALRSPPDPTDPLGALRELRITGARMVVDNRQAGVVWQMPSLDLVLLRDSAGLRGTADAFIDLGGFVSNIRADIVYRADGGGLGVTTRLSQLRPADFAGIAPVLEPLAALDVGFAGSISLELGQDFQPRHVALDLTGGPGRVVLPDLFDQPLDLEGVRLLGRLEDGGRRLTLERFDLDLGQPVLAVAGDVVRRDGRLDLSATAELTDMPMASLGRYWPASVAPNPRSWMLENMADGRFDRTRFRITGSAPADDPTAFEPTAMQGEFDLSGFTLDYRHPLPKARDMGGTARFDGNSFDIRLESGRLLDLTLTQGRVTITGLNERRQAIDIAVGLGGPLASALTVLDHEPLGYISRIGVDPAKAAGRAEIGLTFAFPLLKQILMSDVVMGGRARLTDVSIPDLVADIDASRGMLDLTLDNGGLAMTGDALLNGVPAGITWTETFDDSAPIGTEVRVQATVNDEERDRFRLDFPDWLNGVAGVDLTYRRPRGAPDRIEAELDLDESVLRIDPLNWRKPAGEPGVGVVTVEFVDGKPTRIPRFSVATAELTASGEASLRPADYGLDRVMLDIFQLGRTNARVELRGLPDGTLRIDASGPSFDARPVKARRSEQPPVADPAAGPAEDPGNLDIRFTLDQVVMGDQGEVLRQASGSAFRRGALWEQATLDATVGAAGSLRLRYWPDGDTLSLRLESDDAGAALRDLAILDQVRGGRLLVTGRSDPDDPTRTVSGHMEMTDYQVADAPVLARLLSAISFRGLANFMGGQPIAFSRLEGEFRWHEHGIGLRDLRTSGSAIGITAEGDINLHQGQADLQGTLVPLSTVNRIIGAIPLVGDILTGGDGQGVFAATYSVQGPLGEPQISVNPLAVLAPGFLRNLFFLGEPAGEDFNVPGDQPAPIALPPPPAVVETVPLPADPPPGDGS